MSSADAERVSNKATSGTLRTLAFLEKMRQRHGDPFRIRLVDGHRLLVIGDPELAKQVFHAPMDVLHAGEGNRRVLGWLLGENSLILLDGARHVSHRRLLLPPFTASAWRVTRKQFEFLRRTGWPLGRSEKSRRCCPSCTI